MSFSAEGSRAALVVLAGSGLEPGFSIDLSEEQYAVGRAPDCAINFEDDALSRVHSELRWAGSHYEVVDQRSTNGTFVNDTEVTAKGLERGDRLQVGSVVFRYVESGPEQEPLSVQIASIRDELREVDGLTHALTQRYGVQSLKREMIQAIHKGRQLALCILETDGLNRIERDYGALVRGAVLRQLSLRLRANTRPADVLARHEAGFMLIFPDLDCGSAFEAADTCRKAIDAQPFTWRKERCDVGVSGGVACIDEYVAARETYGVDPRNETPHPQTFVGLVDRKLYQAKRRGGNQVVQ